MNGSDFVLPESLMDFVQERVESGGFRDVGAYIVGLVEADRQKQRQPAERGADESVGAFKADSALEATLLARIESGPKIEMTESDWANIKRESIARLRESQAKSSR